MKLSEEAAKYAEASYGKAFARAALEGRTERRSLGEKRPSSSEVVDYFSCLTRKLLNARVDSYVQAFKLDDLLIDDQDKDQIIEELRRTIQGHVIWGTTESTLREFGWIPTGEAIRSMKSYMTDRFEELLGEAVVCLESARAEMVMERKNRKPNTPNTHYDIRIEGHNFGPIQQGGKSNVQHLAVNAEFSAKIHELLNLIETSKNLTLVQKSKARTDIRYLEELGKMEPSKEVRDEAKSRLDGVAAVIGLTADLVSLGIPSIQILRTFFGI